MQVSFPYLFRELACVVGSIAVSIGLDWSFFKGCTLVSHVVYKERRGGGGEEAKTWQTFVLKSEEMKSIKICLLYLVTISLYNLNRASYEHP